MLHVVIPGIFIRAWKPGGGGGAQGDCRVGGGSSWGISGGDITANWTLMQHILPPDPLRAAGWVNFTQVWCHRIPASTLTRRVWIQRSTSVPYPAADAVVSCPAFATGATHATISSEPRSIVHGVLVRSLSDRLCMRVVEVWITAQVVLTTCIRLGFQAWLMVHTLQAVGGVAVVRVGTMQWALCRLQATSTWRLKGRIPCGHVWNGRFIKVLVWNVEHERKWEEETECNRDTMSEECVEWHRYSI